MTALKNRLFEYGLSGMEIKLGIEDFRAIFKREPTLFDDDVEAIVAMFEY